MAVSRERIAMEVRKLLVARNAVPVVRLMLARGIFAPIVPEIDAGGVDRLARLAEAEAVASISPDPIRRLAALLPPVPETAATIAARLKLSNAERKRLAAAQAPIDEATSEALAYRRGANGAVDALLLRSEEHTSELQSLMRISYAVFCLKKKITHTQSKC